MMDIFTGSIPSDCVMGRINLLFKSDTNVLLTIVNVECIVNQLLA